MWTVVRIKHVIHLHLSLADIYYILGGGGGDLDLKVRNDISIQFYQNYL